MSDLLSIGRSGVVAYRAALAATGENVSNAETEGYSRRVVTIKESSVAVSSNYQYRSTAIFGGADIGSIKRVYDDYKLAYARLSTSSAGYADTKVQWMQVTENALDDSEVGLGVKLSAVFAAGETLSTDASSDPNRQAVLTAIDDAAKQFNTTAGMLKNAADGITSGTQATIDGVNGALKALAQVNIGLQRAQIGTASQAQLLDQRDKLLNTISEAISIDVHFENDGRANVNLSGNTGVTLVDAGRPDVAFIGAVNASDGRFSLIASGLSPQTPIGPLSGSLAALQASADIVASRRQSLNTIAATFADQVNNWNKQGLDKNDDPGVDLITLGSDGAASIALGTTDVAKVAAKSTDGIANGNALVMKDQRTSTGSEARWALLVSTHAQIVATAKSQASAAASQKEGALIGVDEVSGVDLDVEAAQMLRFQQAYSGSAKILQVARETLQEIMKLF
jgi:flagellar hook-associated protein 1 FlgK